MTRVKRVLIVGLITMIAFGLTTGVYASAANQHAGAARKSLQVVTLSSGEFGFQAKKVTVTAGTKVTWTNTTQAPHTVTTTGTPPKSFNKQLAVGGKVSITFSKKGTYHYFCAIHPYMKGTIVVK